MTAAHGLPDAFELMESGRIAVAVRGSAHDLLAVAGLLNDAAFDRFCTTGTALGSGRGGAVRVALPGDAAGAVIVRRSRRGGALGSVLADRYFSPRRFFEELRVAEAARDAGVPVPEYLAVRVRRRSFGWSAEVIVRELAGAVSLQDHLKRRDLDDGRLRQVLSAFADTFNRLVRAGVYHPDLHAGNVLIQETDSGPRACVIDFDRAERAEFVDPDQRDRMLFRFNRALVKRGLAPVPVSLRMRVRFCRLVAPGEDSSAIRRLVHRCSAHLRRHAWRYR